MSTFDAYVICTSPRSGSTLLCGLLRDVGNAGWPESHFHNPSLDSWLEVYGLAARYFDTDIDQLAAVFQAAHERGKQNSDVFGLRLQGQSANFLMRQLARLQPSVSDDVSRFNAAFGKTLFIHLTRENKLDQAISCVKAEQTGLWHKGPDGREVERLSEPKELAYDAAAIASQLREFQQMEVAWQAWFAKENIQPLTITYDALSAAPHETRNQILDKLGLPYEDSPQHPPHVAKMADKTNEEWARRFLQEAESASDRTT